MCNFQSPTIYLLLSHLRTVHGSDPRFHVTCGISGCTVSSKSFSFLYSHIYHRHPNEGVVKKGVTVFESLPSHPSQPTLTPPLFDDHMDQEETDYKAGIVQFSQHTLYDSP